MNKDQIREHATRCGFKLHPQTASNGEQYQDLKPYVYDFANQLLQAANSNATTEGYLALLEKADKLTAFANGISRKVQALEQEAAYWKKKCQALQAGVKQVYLQ